MCVCVGGLKLTQSLSIPYSIPLNYFLQRYFGYVFNPVSFYYIFDGSKNLKCVVAEVSNTPWLEQHSYVLHQHSSDISRSKRLASGDGLNFLFLKKFHVSPFHGMEYVYDWDFSAPGERCRVVTRMRGGGGKVEFVANFDLKRQR